MADTQATHPFGGVPWHAGGHFVLHFYAAVYRLINHIRRLSAVAGGDLERVFEDYPFLAGYFGEMVPFMPDDLTWEAAPGWWRAAITRWEEESPERLPLLALSRESGVDFAGRLALLLVGLVEEDSRFGTLLAELQAPIPHRRPCLELVRAIMATDGADAENRVDRALLAARLVEVVNEQAPRSEWTLRVPPILWEVVRGEGTAALAGDRRFLAADAFPAIDDLIFPDAFRQRVAAVPRLIQSGRATAVVLRGARGSDRRQVAGAVARALGRNVILVEGTEEEAIGHLGPLCAMTHALPVLVFDPGPGDVVEMPSLPGYRGPVGVLAGIEGGVGGPAVERAVTLTLPPARLAQRRRHWEQALPGQPPAALASIGERFHLPGGTIRQVAPIAQAHAALEGREQVTVADVRLALRSCNRQLLDTLATRLEGGGAWDHLVVGTGTTGKLQELVQRCQHRERLLDHLGPAFGETENWGVRALFSGASGTGKTLAARILAAELGMDLYRVDLAAVVNKYIGETEKNLHRILTRAEELDVILLLDEGDALLGSRTEIRSANDRYANLETNYLLQKLEHYQGIVIVTTNAGENIDSAFQRRMDVVVNFILPQAAQRWRIWQLHLPPRHDVDPGYLEKVSVQCRLSGGQIRNAALHATLLAVEQSGGRAGRRQLEEALQSEYRKMGAVFPLAGHGRRGNGQPGLTAFIAGLA